MFGLDLKANENTKFVDILDSKTMLTTAMQGFGRMRGFAKDGGTHFNSRDVYMVGSTRGEVPLAEVFDTLIENEQSEVQKITLQTIDDSIKHSGISLLKNMQDNAEGAPTMLVSKDSTVRQNVPFAVGDSLGKEVGIGYGGVILSTVWKAAKQQAAAKKFEKEFGGMSEYDIFEKKLIKDFWNIFSQDQDNSPSTPQETKEYIEERFASMYSYFQNLSDNAKVEFEGKLSQENQQRLNGFVAESSEVFSVHGETNEIEFLDDNAVKTVDKTRYLYSTGNTFKDVHEIISETIKKDEVPEYATFGASSTATQQTVAQTKQETFASETEAEKDAQESFLRDTHLVRKNETLTKNGQAYVDHLYKEIQNLSVENKVALLSVMQIVGLPPEEKDRSQVSDAEISRSLVEKGFVDLKTLSHGTVDSLMHIVHAQEIFGGQLTNESSEALLQSEKVKEILSADSPELELQNFLGENLQSESAYLKSDALHAAFEKSNVTKELIEIEKKEQEAHLDAPTDRKDAKVKAIENAPDVA